MEAVLQQDGHPIAYISKAFGPRNQAFSLYEKELLAITFAVSKWRHYLEQGTFIIKTDHEYKILATAKVTQTYSRKGLPDCSA